MLPNFDVYFKLSQIDETTIGKLQKFDIRCLASCRSIDSK